MIQDLMNSIGIQRLFLIFLFFFSITVCNAQNYSEDESDETLETELGNNTRQENASLIFNAIGIDNITNPLNQTLVGNSVFLQQIGDFNTVNASVRSTSSDINVVQNGAANDTFLQYEVNTVFTDILQNGNDNNITDFVINPQDDISLDLQQQGNYLTFERYGSNSLTRSLKFTQTAASPTIIIRSFN